MSRSIIGHTSALLAVGVLLYAVAASNSALAQPAENDAHSLCVPTGPAPKDGYQPYIGGICERGLKVIGGVPEYHWRHGCGPTAAGMVIGYWDGRGFSVLIPGDASEQFDNPSIDQAIATGNGAATHYSDYSLPLDYWPDPIQPDLSEPPPGDEHPSDCLGDFMRTSWSAVNMYYGWSWLSNVDNALRDYVDFVNATQGVSYDVESWNELWGAFTWADFVAEIDADRPMVFLVDSDGDGDTDHFVTAIGYRDTNGYPEYACLDTWPVGGPHHGYRWERFRPISSSYGWGVRAATYFSIEGGWHEVAKLLPDDGDADDGFGNSVSVSGDVTVVAAHGDDGAGNWSGSAYVFTSEASGWLQQDKLLASDDTFEFGYSVSVSGDIAVIGEPGDSDYGSLSGSAHVFCYTGWNWTQQAKLLASDGALCDMLGYSVSVSDDVAVVGAPGDDDNGECSGSAYVFRHNGTSWVQEAKLLPDDGAADAYFGCSVSVSGDVAVVGAQYDDDNGIYCGSAYVFRYNGSSWVQEAKLLPDDGAAHAYFGCSVSVSGDVAVVGAERDDDNGQFPGSAYVFRYNGSSWVQEAKLLPDDGAAYAYFGCSVSLSGDVAVVGARGDDDNGYMSGSAYVFHYNGSTWLQEAKLLPGDGAPSDMFGCSVSVSGDVAVIGGDYNDDNGENSGSAYVFEFSAGGGGEPDCPGDLDGDGDIDLADLAQLLGHYGITSGAAYEDGDLDGDGDVDLADLAALLGVYGTTCP